MNAKFTKYIGREVQLNNGETATINDVGEDTKGREIVTVQYENGTTSSVYPSQIAKFIDEDVLGDVGDDALVDNDAEDLSQESRSVVKESAESEAAAQSLKAEIEGIVGDRIEGAHLEAFDLIKSKIPEFDDLSKSEFMALVNSSKIKTNLFDINIDVVVNAGVIDDMLDELKNKTVNKESVMNKNLNKGRRSVVKEAVNEDFDARVQEIVDHVETKFGAVEIITQDVWDRITDIIRAEIPEFNSLEADEAFDLLDSIGGITDLVDVSVRINEVVLKQMLENINGVENDTMPESKRTSKKPVAAESRATTSGFRGETVKVNDKVMDISTDRTGNVKSIKENGDVEIDFNGKKELHKIRTFMKV